MLPDRLVPVYEHIVGEVRRAVEGVQRVLPGAAHADAGLYRPPAERVVARGILGYDRLPHPGAKEAHKALGVALVPGLPILRAEDGPLRVATELPGPLTVLVIGRVDEPVDLAGELVRRAAGD